MTPRHQPAVAVGIGVFAFPTDSIRRGLVDTTYVDPHLVILLFLFGFCLLYAALLAVDVVTQRRSADPNPDE
jgi:hypothetical protein